MRKFDSSTGLSTKEIGAIKYNVKNEISRQLPELSDPVETKLFLQGRSAWTYNWSLLNENSPIELTDPISLEVIVKLKREFHHCNAKTQHKFLCKVQIHEDIYNPKLSATKIT
jgi:hypothetical protein